MFINLIKIILFFLLIYILYRIIRTFFVINKNIKDNIKRRNHVQNDNDENGDVIELSKDQYKVE